MVYTTVLIVSRDYFYNYMQPALLRRRLPPHLACSIPISPSLRIAAHHQHHSPDAAAAAAPHPCPVPSRARPPHPSGPPHLLSPAAAGELRLLLAFSSISFLPVLFGASSSLYRWIRR
jgi:hypothetical protein